MAIEDKDVDHFANIRAQWVLVELRDFGRDVIIGYKLQRPDDVVFPNTLYFVITREQARKLANQLNWLMDPHGPRPED